MKNDANKTNASKFAFVRIILFFDAGTGINNKYMDSTNTSSYVYVTIRASILLI